MTANLITLTDPRAPAADAYRTLRTNLQFSRLDNPLRTLGVTAPAEENNKSKAAANLAVTLAQAGQRTILIDADLRRPHQHSLWGVENHTGLTSLLLGESDVQTALHQTGVENLQLLTAGELPPNPVDVLASARMDQVIGQLQEAADVLIFEAPPVLVAADASVLGQKMDGMLLVVQANKTRRDHTSRAKEQLARVNVTLLGAVLLDAPVERAAAAYR